VIGLGINFLMHQSGKIGHPLLMRGIDLGLCIIHVYRGNINSTEAPQNEYENGYNCKGYPTLIVITYRHNNLASHQMMGYGIIWL
jgi:hypothetical protein